VSDLMQRIIERGGGRTPRVSPVLPSRFENPPFSELSAIEERALVEGAASERAAQRHLDTVPPPPREPEDRLSPDERESPPAVEWVLRAPPQPRPRAIENPAQRAPAAPETSAPPDPSDRDGSLEVFTPAPVERRAANRERIAPPAHAPAPETVTVNLTIGHIELKSAPSTPPKPVRRPAPPRVSLDDYLKRRNGGAR
jgi:hypothetical protein